MAGSSVSTSLLDRLKGHDPDAWSAFWSLYGREIHHWCRLAGLRAHDAEDVTQEVFRSVSVHLADFRRERPGDSFRGWLWTITQNKIRDHWRHMVRQPEAAGGTDAQLRIGQVPSSGWDEASSSVAAMGGPAPDLVRRALDCIRSTFEERTWRAFWEVVVQERPVAEVAKELGMSPNAVYIARSRSPEPAALRVRRFTDLTTGKGGSGMSIACPDRQRLLAWSLGLVDAFHQEEIASHVSSCDSCLSSLDALEMPTDPIVDQIRRPGPVDSIVEESADPDPTPVTRLLTSVSANPSFPDVPDSAELRAGSVVGPYVIHEEIRRGGMGAVYRARHTLLNRVVALKVLPPDRFRDPHALARFRREMESAGAIDHPNLVHASDAGESGGTHYLVMEYIDGLDLDRLVREHGPLPVPTACEIVRQAAQGLEHARQKGLVHRDVKPSNIMLTRDGRVKLLDLGLALLRDGRAQGVHLTDSGVVLGTVAYMAPEQASEPHGVDIRADLYSLGCTLYFLLAGRPPFGGNGDLSPIKTLLAHAHEPAPPIQAIRPEVPESLAAVLERLMAKSPVDRFQTPSEVSAVLEPYCDDAPARPLAEEPDASAERTAPATASHGSWRRIPPWTAVAALMLLGGMLMAQQIILRIRHKDGTTTDIPLKPGDILTIAETDPGRPPAPPTPPTKPDTRPPVMSSAPLTLKSNQPMSTTALVQAPATLPGVQSWTIETRRPRATGRMGVVAYDPHGRWLAVGSPDGVIRLFDARDGRLIRVLVGHDTPVLALASHPRRAILASASDQDHSTVRIWDTETGRLIREFPGFPGGTYCLAWSPDGQTLALGGHNGLRLWDVDTGKGSDIRDSTAQTNCLAWSPDGDTLAFDLSENGPYLFAVRKSEPRRFLPHDRGVMALAWSPDGRTLALGHHAISGVSLVDAATGLEVGRLEQQRPCKAIAFSPDGNAIATSEGVSLWDAQTRHERLHRPCQGFSWAHSLSWSPDGKAIASGNDFSIIAVCSVETGSNIRIYEPLFDSSYGYYGSWSLDGSRLAMPAKTGLDVWDAVSYESLGNLSLNNGNATLSPDGRLVASFEKGVLRILDVQSKGEVQSIPTSNTNVDDGPYSTWSPDGRTVAVQREKRIALLDLDSGGISRTIDFPAKADLIFAWSPDGKVLAAAGSSPIHLFDIASGQKRILGDPDKPHAIRFTALMWSPDGKRLACGDGAELQVWDAAEGRRLIHQLAHAGGIRRLVWSADGKTLFSGGVTDRGADEVKTWDVTAGTLRQTRHRVGYTLSPDGTRVADFEPASIHLYDLESGRGQGTIVVMPALTALAFSPDGHYRGSRGIEEEIVYVIQTDKGQETLTPGEFAARFPWKNDPSRVGTVR